MESLDRIFEQQVAELLSMMGYHVQRDVLIAGKQVDIIAEFLAPGGIRIRILVECKHTTRHSIPNDEIYEFGSVFNAIKTTEGLTQGVLVSNASFTRFAKDAAEKIGVRALTYGDLLGEVADFSRYLRGFVDEYKSLPISLGYIQLQCCTARQLKQLESGRDDRERRAMMSEYGVVVDDYLQTWVDSNSTHHILLLGDYGTGKSTICSRLTYTLAEAYLRGGIPNRIPLLINLRDYTRGPGARHLITDFLVNQCRLSINYDTFRRLNSSGRFVLILDGFDEMAVRVDAGTVSDIILNLMELMSEGSKVILTGRPGYFPSQQELEARFRSEPPEDPYERAYAEQIDEGHLHFRHHYVLPLSRPQILEMLKKRSRELSKNGNMTYQQVMDIIENTYNLADLAERPVLLDMIIKTIPSLANEVGQINAAKLYEIYTNFWLKREELKGRTLIGKTEKLLFMEELAIQMMVKGQLTIHYQDLGPAIKGYFRISDSDSLDHFAHDIRTCSFLRRDASGYYVFAHKSFMEYFVASKMMGEIRSLTNWHFGRRPLTGEILGFVQEGIAKEDHDILAKWLLPGGSAGTQQGKYTATNALAILMLSGHDCDGLDLRAKTFEGLDLEGSTLRRAKLTGCTLIDCNLTRAQLDGALLDRATLSGTTLRHAALSGATFFRTALNGVDLEGTYLENADFTEAAFAGIKGWDKVGSFKGVRLSGATGLRYEDWDFARIRGSVGEPLLSRDELERRARDSRVARDKMQKSKRLDQAILRPGKAKHTGKGKTSREM
jgi:hypothetical protein